MTIILMLQKILDRFKILILRSTLALLKLNNTPMAREDMLQILKTLNPKKATGCDQIPAKLLKHASSQIAPVISNIINKALDVAPFQKQR